MKTTSPKLALISALLLGVGLAAAPAIAKTSLSKGEALCKAAARAAQPAPKSVSADDDNTRFNDSTLTFTLKVKTADGASTKQTCKVDRGTDAVTLIPAP